MICSYHHGTFVPDARGCCAACGAPRIFVEDEDFDNEEENNHDDYIVGVDFGNRESWTAIAGRKWDKINSAILLGKIGMPSREVRKQLGIEDDDALDALRYTKAENDAAKRWAGRMGFTKPSQT